MKPQSNVFDVQSTVQGEKVAMGVKLNAMNHIMDMLAGLYSNNVRAIIREYSTNALDAQLEAGVSRPIEVTLPSSLSQFFKVQDFGTGMDEDTIREVYSQYGESTKRASNEFNGMLGVGCKSALAYQAQFTVSSIKDGQRIEVAVGRDSEGAGYMLVQTRYATTDADGTTVTVPVERQDILRFDNEARNFFKVWPAGTVRVNGAPPERFDGLKVTDDMFILDRMGTAAIVMGNVAYPCPELHDLVPSGRVLAFVKMGTVQFAPSREALKYTDSTRKQIDLIKARFRKAITTSAQKEIDAQPSPIEAVEKMLHWDRYVPSANGDYTYKDKPLTRTLDVLPFNPPRYTKPDYVGAVAHQLDNKFITIDRSIQHVPRGAGSRNARKQIELSTVVRGVFIEGYKPEKYSLDHHRKVRQFAEEEGIDGKFNRIILCREGVPSSPWIAHVLKWEDIRKIRLDAKATGYGRIPGSYDLYDEDHVVKSTSMGSTGAARQYNVYGRSGIPGADIRQDVPLFHVRGNLQEAHRFAKVLHDLMPAFTLVCLPKNRLEKWEREVKRSVHVRDHVELLLESWKKSLTKTEKIAVALADNRTLRSYPLLDGKRTNDPALREAIQVAKMTGVDKLVEKVTERRNRFEGVITRHDIKISGEDPIENYPLFCWSVLKDDPNHVYNYVNAAYAAA